jgi:hypothetical protein
MKKIPTLFVREFENHHVIKVTDQVTPGFEWVLDGLGKATIKYDGACIAIIDGVLYKRYDAKKGKTPPVGAIPCGEPDPVTGHWPHWVKVDFDDPADKWFVAAYENAVDQSDGTYEVLGPHFQGNPYHLGEDVLERHGADPVVIQDREDEPGRSFESIKRWLETHGEEGLVFWKDGEPQCKIKRSDFGLPWPIKREEDT